MKLVRRALCCFIATLLVACSGGGDDALPDRTPLPARTPEATPGIDLTVPVGDRIRIPGVGIDAPIVLLTVGRDGRMPDPPTPDDVALYDFAAFPGLGGAPGKGGNVVLAGNVDSDRPCNEGRVPPPCEAVFWHLPRVEVGAQLAVFYGRQPFAYTVKLRCVAEVATAFEAALKSTPQETLTIITGTGEFVPGRGYLQRLLVLGERTAGALSTCPEGTQPASVPLPRNASIQATFPPQERPDTQPLTLTHERQQPPGTYAGPPAELIPHRFHATGLVPGSLPSPPSDAVRISPALPRRPDGAVPGLRREGDALIVLLPPDTPSGRYEVTLTTTDGRSTKAGFSHTRP